MTSTAQLVKSGKTLNVSIYLLIDAIFNTLSLQPSRSGYQKSKPARDVLTFKTFLHGYKYSCFSRLHSIFAITSTIPIIHKLFGKL